MATGMWDAMFTKTSASAKLSANGDLEVASAASDIGTGTYTVMTQIAAETLGLPPERITARLGDCDLPTRRSRAARGWRPRPARRCSSPAAPSARSC